MVIETKSAGVSKMEMHSSTRPEIQALNDFMFTFQQRGDSEKVKQLEDILYTFYTKNAKRLSDINSDTEAELIAKAIRETNITINGAREYLDIYYTKKELDESKYDKRTGLLNTSTLDKEMAFFIEGKRNEDKKPFAVIFIDLDFLKAFNSSYHHKGGDLALKHTAKLMKIIFNQPADKIFRYGGDEFLILAHGSKEEIKGRVEQLQELRKQESFEVTTKDGKKIQKEISLSIGVIHSEGIELDQLNQEILIDEADKLQELAKKHQRGITAYGWEDNTHLVDRKEQQIEERAIELAIKEGVDEETAKILAPAILALALRNADPE